MRVWYDTEFIEGGPEHPISLISIGAVAEDGREFYAVNWDMPRRAILRHRWLMENVVPHLPLREYRHEDGPNELIWDRKHADFDRLMDRNEIGRELLAFLTADGVKPELWGWYSSYDHVVLAQIYGTMVQMPDQLPYYTRDLKQEVDRLRLRVPVQKASEEHNALADARWTREVGLWLDRKMVENKMI